MLRLLLPCVAWLLVASPAPGAAPPEGDSRLKKWEEQLKKRPGQPSVLVARARWRLDHLNFKGAIADLEQLLAGKPPRWWADRARLLLLRSICAYCSHDFAAAVKHVERRPRLLGEQAGWLTESERTAAPGEYRQVLALRCYLRALRGERDGKPLAELDALFSLAGVNAPEAVIPARGDAGRKLSFSLWARERLEGLLARDGKATGRALAARWRAAKLKKDEASLRELVALVEVGQPLGREARLHLAARLAAKGYHPEADQLLQEVRRGPDRSDAAKAVLALAEMMTRAGQMRDAVTYHRLLERHYARAQVAPGRTGADVWNDVVTDKRFLPFLEEPSGVLRGRFNLRYLEERVDGPEREGFTFAPRGRSLPLFHQRRLTLVGNDLRIRDSGAPRNRFELRLDGPTLEGIGGDPGFDQPVGYDVQSLGHVAVLNLGARVVGVDPLRGRILWQHDVLGLGKVAPWVKAVASGPHGFARIHYAEVGSVRLGDPLPLTPTRLCLATKAGLVALDPLTGVVRWSRGDVSPDCRLFHDDKHVFVVLLGQADKITGTAAYRLQDGSRAAIKDFSCLFTKRLRILDGRLLLQEVGAGKAPVLRLYDVAACKDVWRQAFLPGALPILCEDEELTGVVEPKGEVFVLEARTKKPVMSGKLIKASHIEKAKAIRMVGDREDLYLAIEGPRGEEVPTEPRSLFSARAGLRAIPVNGMIYAFRRATGQVQWYNPAYNQTLLVSDFKRLPAVLLAARWGQWIGQPRGRRAVNASAVKAIAKHNGKVWYFTEDLPLASSIHAVGVDRRTGAIYFDGTKRKVTLRAVPK
jgi:hypothetical protein